MKERNKAKEWKLPDSSYFFSIYSRCKNSGFFYLNAIQKQREPVQNLAFLAGGTF
jgi:hypothetical protein